MQKRKGYFEQRTLSKKKTVKLWQWLVETTTGRFTQLFSKSSEPKRLVRHLNKVEWKKVYLRTTTKLIPLLQPELGFCYPEAEHLLFEYYSNSSSMLSYKKILKISKRTNVSVFMTLYN